MGQASEFLEQMTALWVKGDVDGLVGHYADDATLTVPGATVQGRGQLRDYWAGQMAGSDKWAELGRSVESGDLVFSEFVVPGTMTAPLPLPNGTTVEPTGRGAEVKGLEMLRVTGGRVVEHVICYDLLDLLTQFGVAPA
jgi:hypothetical protein